MGKVRKLLESELVGGTLSEDVYPVTSCAAVYRSDNKRLDDILKKNLPVNASTINAGEGQQSMTLAQAIAAVPVSIRALGQIITYTSGSSYYVKQFNGTSLSDYTNLGFWMDFAGGGATMKVILLESEEDFNRIEVPDANTFYCW